VSDEIRRCAVRVWDNGAVCDCGKELRSRESICRMHRNARLRELQRHIEGITNTLRVLQAERGRLEAEAADPGGLPAEPRSA